MEVGWVVMGQGVVAFVMLVVVVVVVVSSGGCGGMGKAPFAVEVK